MAERVDAEGAVLHDNNARYAGNKECAKRGSPAAPRITIAAGSTKATLASIREYILLPHDEPVSLQIANVVKGRRRLELEKQPADVRLD